MSMSIANINDIREALAPLSAQYIKLNDKENYQRKPISDIGNSKAQNSIENQTPQNITAPEVGYIECQNLVLHREGLESYISNPNNGQITLAPFSKTREESIVYHPSLINQPKTPVVLTEPTLFLGFAPPIFNNYGHLLIDQLPILHHWKQLKAAGFRTILFHSIASKTIRKRIKQMIRLYYGAFNDINIKFSMAPALQFNRVAIPWRTSIHPGVKHPIVRDFYHTQVSKKYAGPSKKLKLFISREDASDRKLVNEQAIYAYLKPRGFKFIQGSKLDPKSAMKLFSNAEIIIGVSGASMASMVYCRPGTTFINIISSENPGYWYWDLANLFGLNYRIFQSDMYTDKAADPKYINRKSRDFVVDADQFFSSIGPFLE